jgi:hypothetical protein
MNQEFINRCEAAAQYTLEPNESVFRRFREALRKRTEKAYESLYEEFTSSWMKSPTVLIRTPGYDKQATAVSEVISEHFAGQTGEADEIELLRIVAEVAATPNELGQRARNVIHNIASRHAAFHTGRAL